MSNILTNLFRGAESNDTSQSIPTPKESHCTIGRQGIVQENDKQENIQNKEETPQKGISKGTLNNLTEGYSLNEKLIYQLVDNIQHELYKTVLPEIKEIVSPIATNISSLHQLIGEINFNHHQNETIQNVLLFLQDKVGNVLEAQERTIQKQHNAALKFQEDVIYKTQKSLIMELIGIADNIRMIIQNSETDTDYDLLGAVKDLEKWVDASLNNNSVRKFQDVDLDSTTMNRKRQVLVNKEETNIVEEHNTYKTVSPGYEWSIPYLVINSEVQLGKILEDNNVPQLFSYVVRPEEIVKLEYKENEED
ncbi:MAG: hypothetical protein J6L60_05645 [Bacteroidaceae bacterium]|nr:hypothetical protein [Bacteroidaceae bacterium]